MKWTKSYTSDLDDFKIEELKTKHHSRGIAVRDTLIKVLAKHLNPFAPGYYRFPKRVFFAYFDGIACSRTVEKILNYLSEIHEVFYVIIGHEIFIIAPIMDERIDEFAKKVQKGLVPFTENINKWQNEAPSVYGACMKNVKIPDKTMKLPDLIRTETKGDTA